MWNRASKLTLVFRQWKQMPIRLRLTSLYLHFIRSLNRENSVPRPCWSNARTLRNSWQWELGPKSKAAYSENLETAKILKLTSVMMELISSVLEGSLRTQMPLLQRELRTSALSRVLRDLCARPTPLQQSRHAVLEGIASMALKIPACKYPDPEEMYSQLLQALESLLTVI